MLGRRCGRVRCARGPARRRWRAPAAAGRRVRVMRPAPGLVSGRREPGKCCGYGGFGRRPRLGAGRLVGWSGLSAGSDGMAGETAQARVGAPAAAGGSDAGRVVAAAGPGVVVGGPGVGEAQLRRRSGGRVVRWRSLRCVRCRVLSRRGRRPPGQEGAFPPAAQAAASPTSGSARVRFRRARGTAPRCPTGTRSAPDGAVARSPDACQQRIVTGDGVVDQSDGRRFTDAGGLENRLVHPIPDVGEGLRRVGCGIGPAGEGRDRPPAGVLVPDRVRAGPVEPLHQRRKLVPTPMKADLAHN